MKEEASMAAVFKLILSAIALGLAWLIHKWMISSPTEVCYEGLGCFSNEEPFHNAWGKLPESPDKLNMSFLLYTRGNDETADYLYVFDAGKIVTSRFNSSKYTKIIVHGMGENALDVWPQELKNAILSKDDVNVIVVDWHDGAGTITNPLTYIQAVANTRVVGAVMANFIKALNMTTGASFGRIHLIGHSLGGHVVGYAGEKVNRLGRVTGLDPANALFDGYGPRVGLDKTDAEFVDVIHTDMSPLYTLGFGTEDTRGHAGFYPNGGSQSEACGSKLVTFTKLLTGDFWGAVTVVFCSHVQSVEYFIQSVQGANYTSYPCASIEDCTSGRCTACQPQCHQMGYYADKGTIPKGTYYLYVKPLGNS